MSVATNADAGSSAATWHAISADEVVTRLATSGQKGLDAAEASARLRKHGPNRLPEGKAEKALDSIRNMLSAEARTVRGGETRMIPAEQLVPGDVVVLESGDKI